MVEASKLARALHVKAGALVALVTEDALEVVEIGTGLDASTPMQIGSVTKVFTALLLAEAIRRDELKLSDQVDEVLFGLRWAGAPSITAGELATHLSGLPRLSFGWWRALQADPYRGYTRTALLQYLEQTQPRSPESPAYSYSNLGYTVLGLLLEKAASLPFERLLQERVLHPMGMTQLRGCNSSEAEIWLRKAFTSSGTRASLWHMDAYAPCGAMVSTLEDLALATRCFLDAGSPIAASLALTIEPRAAVPGGSIGLAWVLPAAGAAYWHNGATAGYCAYLGVNTRSRMAAVVLANQNRAQEISELGTQLMGHIRAASTASEGAG